MSRSIIFVVCEGALLGSSVGAGAPLERLIPAAGSLAALQRLSQAGYEIVLLRSDTSADVADDAFLVSLLRSQGIAVAAVERCMHAGAAGCDCRPPGLGLVRDYLAASILDRGRSLVVCADASGPRLAADMGLPCEQLTDTGTGPDWAAFAHRVLDAPRTAVVERRTKETSITVRVDLDREAAPAVTTGIGFFDHMLEQLGKHGGFALELRCDGDLEVDEHHTVEDVALALGEALRQALGRKLGIARYGFVLPMDEATAQVAVDLSGRAYFVFEGTFGRESVGGLPTELVPHFFRSLSDSMAATLHLRLAGDNDHHKIEAAFKGLARTLRQAFRRNGDELPSTKGVL